MSSAADSDIIKMKILSLLMIGVALIGVASCEKDQSEPATPDEPPIAEQGNEEKRKDVPEVVLQLKYDGGELNRIYLTQFRKPKMIWYPSVSVQTSLCEDLCHAGLGGDICGPTCRQLLPVGLQTALIQPNETMAVYGQPRVAVCPALCRNYLGQPLCQCPEMEEKDTQAVQWSEVCTAFCRDGYNLSGCPPCEVTPSQVLPTITSFRALGTAEGWQFWCNVQCPQGNGGLACNCDRLPFH